MPPLSARSRAGRGGRGARSAQTSARLLAAAALAAAGARAQPTSANAAAIAACRAQLPATAVFNVLNGTSGVSGNVVLSSSAAGLTTSASCTGFGLTSYPKHVWAINLGDDTWLGGTITAMTWAPIDSSVTFDTVIHVGVGCPTSAASFGCLGGNDDSSAVCGAVPGALGTQSAYVLTNFNSGVLYALVSGYSGATGTYSFSFSYTDGAYPPSPSSTATPTGTASPPPSPTRPPLGTPPATGSATGSPSLAPSPSRTPPATGSATGSPSATASPSPPPTGPTSGSGSPSPSRPPSPTGSASATAPSTLSRSGSATPTPTPPASRSPPPTASRSPTPSQPLRRPPVVNVTLLRGAAGSVAPLSTIVAGNPGMYTSGTCAGGYRTFFPGSRLVYALRLQLGAATPLGGTLTVTTCGLKSNDTVLYVGTGCPTWYLPFACLAGSDNDAACAGNPLASTVTLAGVAQADFFVQLGGHGGDAVASGLAWRYAPPSTSPTSTASRTGSRRASRSRAATASRSATGSRSRSRKPK